MDQISRIHDWRWGALEENLQAKSYTPDQIEQAKEQITNVIRDPTSSITEEIKGLYQIVFPSDRQARILAIRKEALAFVQQKIAEVVSNSPEFANTTLKSLKEPNSFFNDRLRALRRLGELDTTNWYYHFNFSGFENKEDRERSAHEIAHEIIEAFNSGSPTSFPMMANILYSRKIAHTSLTKMNPISDIPTSLFLLNRLAELGDKTAQHELHQVFLYNKIGIDENKVKLTQTNEQRIEGLRKLAFAGDPFSQHELGAICYHRSLFGEPVCIPELQRREWIQQLQQVETGFNFYLMVITRDNRIRELPLGLTLKTRFSILEKRARVGDENAFAALFKSYEDNELGKDDLRLTMEERLSKLMALKSINPRKWEWLMTNLVISNRAGLWKPIFSDPDRLAWLQEQAFKADDFTGAPTFMATIYVRNVYKTHTGLKKELNLPLKDRIEKLFTLADKGCEEAQKSLLIYFKVLGGKDKMARQADEQVEISREDLFQHMLNWSSETSRHALLNCFEDESIKESLEYLFKMRKAIEFVINHCR